jgi:glycosyltransferase involved in cell wall biosynthesis
MPMSLLEAMACGLPCVAYRLPGATDALIDDGRTGLLVDPDRPEALAAAVQRLVADPALRETLGRAAREQVLARSTIRHSAPLYLDMYHRLTGRPPVPSTIPVVPPAGPPATDALPVPEAS